MICTYLSWCSLKQHNGELKGGAKASRAGRPWICACIICGFTDRSEGICVYFFVFFYLHHDTTWLFVRCYWLNLFGERKLLIYLYVLVAFFLKKKKLFSLWCFSIWWVLFVTSQSPAKSWCSCIVISISYVNSTLYCEEDIKDQNAI